MRRVPATWHRAINAVRRGEDPRIAIGKEKFRKGRRSTRSGTPTGSRLSETARHRQQARDHRQGRQGPLHALPPAGDRQARPPPPSIPGPYNAGWTGSRATASGPVPVQAEEPARLCRFAQSGQTHTIASSRRSRGSAELLHGRRAGAARRGHRRADRRAAAPADGLCRAAPAADDRRPAFGDPVAALGSMST